MAEAKIVVRNVRRVYETRRKRVEALAGIDLDIFDGEFFVVVGPSGCGKTTLLRILAGLDRPTAGTVTINRRDPSRPLNAMVFQQESIFPWMTVRQNVEYGLRVRRVPAPVRRRIVDHYLKVVNLADFDTAYPHQLSGGMKQRVSIARAFANDPEILLMDEPFAALDEQTKLLLQGELLRIWEGSAKTVCYITHSIDEAISLGDRIAVMTAQPGRIKLVLEVGIERPREIPGIRKDPRYADLYGIVWEALREEVERARGAPFA